MPDLFYDPPVPAKATNRPFFQRVELRRNEIVIASAYWHTAATPDAVAQLLDINVAPEQQRKGHGSTVLAAVITQVVAHGKSRGVPARRVWVSLGQKSEVNARAFLTRHGFHHVATIKELLHRQDALVYLRSLD